MSFAITTAHHKASVEEDGAVICHLVVTGLTPAAVGHCCSKEAERDAEFSPAPLNRLEPKAPPLYCYIGCGIDRQPECITGMAARTNEATEERIDADPAMRVVDYWADLATQQFVRVGSPDACDIAIHASAVTSQCLLQASDVFCQSARHVDMLRLHGKR